LPPLITWAGVVEVLINRASNTNDAITRPGVVKRDLIVDLELIEYFISFLKLRGQPGISVLKP